MHVAKQSSINNIKMAIYTILSASKSCLKVSLEPISTMSLLSFQTDGSTIQQTLMNASMQHNQTTAGHKLQWMNWDKKTVYTVLACRHQHVPATWS